MQRIALVAFSVILLACGKGPARPDLPASVSPGWKLTALKQSPTPPPEIPAGGTPDCWQASYVGTGTAEVWLCRYSNAAGALDAAQRAITESQAVKFQEGEYLVLVNWNNAPISDLTALIRTVQKTLSRK